MRHRHYESHRLAAQLVTALQTHMSRTRSADFQEDWLALYSITTAILVDNFICNCKSPGK